MDKRMMLAWLQGQAQKQELTTTKMQQKRLGIFEQTGVPDSEEPEESLEKRIKRHFSPTGIANWPKPWTQEDEDRMNMHNAESERISKIPGAGTSAGGPDAYSIPAPMERPPDAGKEETWFDRALSLGQEYQNRRKISPRAEEVIDSAKEIMTKQGASKADTDRMAEKMTDLAVEKPGTVGKIVAMPRKPSGQTPQMKTNLSLTAPSAATPSDLTPEARERIRRLGY